MKIKIKGSHSLLALILSIFAYGCHFPSDIGFGNDGSLTAFYTDTLSLNYSTVLADSAINSNSEMILTGKANDPQLGTVEAISYFQPSLSPIYLGTGVMKTDELGNVVFDTLNIPQGAILDSLHLRLYSREFVYGDTAQVAKFRIHRLKNILNIQNYHPNQSQEYEPEPIAEFDFSQKAMRDPVTGRMTVKFVSLPLDIIHELIGIGNESNGDNSIFISKFKGFAIVPDADNKAIYGFSTGALDMTGANSSLIPYWHMEGDTTADLHILNLNGPRYSQLSFDRGNTVLSELSNNNNELSNDATSGRVYLQGGSGIMPKIDFNPLASLGNIKINKATLEFNANSGTVDPLFRGHNYFVIAEADKNNQQIRNANGIPLYLNGNRNDFSGQLYAMVDSSKYLNIDVTRYLQKMVTDNDYDKQIILMPANPISQSSGISSNDHLSRLVFLKPRILLYYNRQ